VAGVASATSSKRRIAAELRGHLDTIGAMTRAIADEIQAIEALPAALLGRALQEVEAA
jgi:ADP-ribosylglycohydrolase